MIMPTSLTSSQETLLQRLVDAGRFQNASEALETALRLLEKREQHYQQWLQDAQHKIAIGIDQLDRGEGLDGDDVIERLQAKITQARSQD
jgi:antitoxin ParD1/3/4